MIGSLALFRAHAGLMFEDPANRLPPRLPGLRPIALIRAIFTFHAQMDLSARSI
jgi:hypothetical protein